jgi:hypothetical protein
MIVGRFLQLAGADLTYEPEGKSGKRIDFKAAFDDGIVLVEATSPEYNWQGEEAVRAQRPLLDILSAEAPQGWWIAVEELPAHEANDKHAPFRRAVRELLARLPDPSVAVETFELEAELANGRVRLSAFPGQPQTDPLAMTPGATLMDDLWGRISKAVRAKREQARAFRGIAPVLLALDSNFYTDRGDFDLALFAKGDGALTSQREAEVAGVLVFSGLGFTSGLDPVLYIHPLFDGRLPDNLGSLERREWTAEGLKIKPSVGPPILERLPFIDHDSWGQMSRSTTNVGR